MSPETVCLTIRSVAEAIKAACEFAATEQGQKLIAKSIEDRAAWDKFWADIDKKVGGWFKQP